MSAAIPQTAGQGFKTYCLGVGCMSKCKTCLHDQNWQTLNQMPDAMRKTMQAEMERMDDSFCQITSGRLYAPKAAA